jgi:hypothetical protein
LNKGSTDIKTKNTITEDTQDKDAGIADHVEQKENEERAPAEKERTPNPEIDLHENKIIDSKFIMPSTILDYFSKNLSRGHTVYAKIIIEKFNDITAYGLWTLLILKIIILAIYFCVIFIILKILKII